MKSKIKTPSNIDDLAQLAKLGETKEWKTFVRMAQNRIQYQKDHIISLPELNPVKLAIDKAYDRGLIAGLLIGIKNVETAATEMEKLASENE